MFNRFKLIFTLACLMFAGLAGTPAASARTHEVIITNRVCVRPGLKWNPAFWVGNLNDPVPPPAYRPHDPHRISKWYFRNPCHNFNFYVIGVADKPFPRVGSYPDKNFNPHGGWTWAVCKYKWLRLPYVSYERGSFRFYLGWRNRGNFGIKLNFQLAR